MKAAEKQMKRLGEDENESQLKLQAGQGVIEDVFGAVAAPNAGGVQGDIDVAEII